MPTDQTMGEDSREREGLLCNGRAGNRDRGGRDSKRTGEAGEWCESDTVLGEQELPGRLGAAT